MKVLVADDSKTNLAYIALVLNKLGHEMIPVTNGKEAVEMFKAIRPDLIILDVNMAEMNGYQAAKAIRIIDNDNWIPIIFLSAIVDDASFAKGIDAGGDDYLAKPCSEVMLVAKIKSVQRISDMHQQLVETLEKLYSLSSTDPLTGVYNRLQFDRSIKEILLVADRTKNKIALLLIDLDNFKNINDSFGHHIGDLLLIETSKRLKSCIRASDFLARLGSDEFAIVLTEIESENEAELVTQKIIDELSLEYHLENHNIRNCASIGVSIYPLIKTTKENIMLNANVAMYHAKASGRNNFKLYRPELDDKYRYQISLEHALKYALEKNELSLTYQPIYDLYTNKLTGLEALICWDHPKYGIVAPSLFVPLAEEIGLINVIGSWVVSTALEQASKWPLNKFENFKFAINISSRQLIHEDFYTYITDLLNKYNLSPTLLQLELTETALMTYNTGPFKETINKLHDYGVHISIDDFGTGYSSLLRLKHLPIDSIKIEQTFIQDAIHNQNVAIIVSCLIALGKNLSMNVIAEGIETLEQLEFLIERQCPQGQGYFLCKPLTADKMTTLIDKELKKEKNIKA